MIFPINSDGLRFSCTRCSVCCRGEPGYVFLTKDDLRRLLFRFSLDFKSFYSRYCIWVDEGTGMALTLRETGTFDCILWGDEGCTAYNERPVQCSTYPFWPSIMDSMDSWNAEAFLCPGIGIGELHSMKYIEEHLNARRGAGTIVLSYGVDPECLDEDTILGSEGFGSDAVNAIKG